MDCRNTMRFEIHKNKRIGQVLFIVEGLKTEPNMLYKVFSEIFGYQMDRLFRDGVYRRYHRTDDPYSRITVINAEQSNIRFIDKDNEFLNHMFEVLIEDYQLDIDNAAIYYLFDRDPQSNTDELFIRTMLHELSSARDVNINMTRQGLLLLSYPCIEGFVGMNFLTNSIQYCWTNSLCKGSALKQRLNDEGLLNRRFDENAILHCTDELLKSLNIIGVDTSAVSLLESLDHFSDTNVTVFDWQESVYKEKGQYGLLSLLSIALLDLGMISMQESE